MCYENTTIVKNLLALHKKKPSNGLIQCHHSSTKLPWESYKFPQTRIEARWTAGHWLYHFTKFLHWTATARSLLAAYWNVQQLEICEKSFRENINYLATKRSWKKWTPTEAEVIVCSIRNSRTLNIGRLVHWQKLFFLSCCFLLGLFQLFFRWQCILLFCFSLFQLALVEWFDFCHIWFVRHCCMLWRRWNRLVRRRDVRWRYEHNQLPTSQLYRRRDVKLDRP